MLRHSRIVEYTLARGDGIKVCPLPRTTKQDVCETRLLVQRWKKIGGVYRYLACRVLDPTFVDGGNGGQRDTVGDLDIVVKLWRRHGR